MIFGSITDGIHEVGLSDATDHKDFFSKLMSLESKWNEVERNHRYFLLNEQ